jgi:hypothetical protein
VLFSINEVALLVWWEWQRAQLVQYEIELTISVTRLGQISPFEQIFCPRAHYFFSEK